MMLQIDNLHADVAGKPILKGLSLSVNAGEVHAIMGPNGAGKSTLGYVLGGRPGCEVTSGTVRFTPSVRVERSRDTSGTNTSLDFARDERVGGSLDLLALEPHERAAAGLFLGFQYPVEIPGVSNLNFLRTALNAQRKIRGEAEASGAEFMKLIKGHAEVLGFSMDMLKRPVNVGFSGGEKKRNEMVQMAVMSPRLAVLDETDSGLDIDALRVVADGINRLRSAERATLLITHYQRLLDYVVPDFVHVLVGGRIVRSGGAELAHELEREGYGAIAA